MSYAELNSNRATAGKLNADVTSIVEWKKTKF